ncbi:MAG: NAD(P)-dependent oxidoreductase [Candidatus Woykebacteria bacterium]
MFRVQVLDAISSAGLGQFPSELYLMVSKMENSDAILVRSAILHGQKFPISLKAVGRAGVGVDNIPVEELSRSGVVVFNTPGANANAVKEVVLSCLTAAARNIAPAFEFVRNLQGTDEDIKKVLEVGKGQFRGIEIAGKTLGVVGLGAVGGEVANGALFLGMRVLGFDPDITVEGAWKLSPQVQPAHSLDEVLSRADFITFHVPLSATTQNMIDTSRLEKMRDGVIVLNFSREGIVDEAALISALDSGKVRAYVTDFPTSKVKGHPRVSSLPHVGALTQESEENCARMIAQQVRDFLEDGNIHNSVNFPEISLPRSTEFRLVVANVNVPEMIAQITTTVGRAGVNIDNMENRHRGNVAYNILDLDEPVDQFVLRALRRIDGVTMVRAIN